jgi:hypothetical protein
MNRPPSEKRPSNYPITPILKITQLPKFLFGDMTAAHRTRDNLFLVKVEGSWSVILC